MNNFPNFTAQLLSKTNLQDAAKVTGKGQIYFINKLRRGVYETESTC